VATGFTSVDLSRLPAPTVVEVVDFETILAAMLADLQARDPNFTALVESDPAYKILEVCAYREMLIRERVNTAAQAVMLAYARGADLDQLGALLGTARHTLDPGNSDEGVAPTMESDEDFRRRIQLAPDGFSVAGPEGAYVFHALSANADVLDASATSPSPGEVVVPILSRTGNGTASPALLDHVDQALASDDVRPMTDHVTVQSAEIVPYNVMATVFTFAGPDSSVVLSEANTRLSRYIEESHWLGRDVPLSGLYAALHVDGVQRVELTEPLVDVVIGRTQASHCTGVTITYGGVDE